MRLYFLCFTLMIICCKQDGFNDLEELELYHDVLIRMDDYVLSKLSCEHYQIYRYYGALTEGGGIDTTKLDKGAVHADLVNVNVRDLEFIWLDDFFDEERLKLRRLSSGCGILLSTAFPINDIMFFIMVKRFSSSASAQNYKVTYLRAKGNFEFKKIEFISGT